MTTLKFKRKYKFQIIEGKEYKFPKGPFILSWRNIKDKDRLLGVLDTFGLNKKEKGLFSLKSEYNLNLVDSHFHGYSR
ncbi:MAG: hypothetical protein ACFFDK_12505 [Promethearchaeota archaeon]